MARKKKSDLPLAITVAAVTFALITAIAAFALFQKLEQMKGDLKKAEDETTAQRQIAEDVLKNSADAAVAILGGRNPRLEAEQVAMVKALVTDNKDLVTDGVADNVAALLREIRQESESLKNKITDADTKRQLAQDLLENAKAQARTNEENAAREIESLKQTQDVIKKELREIQRVNKEEVSRLKKAHGDAHKKWSGDLSKQKTKVNERDKVIVDKDKEIARLEDLLKPTDEAITTPDKPYKDKNELADGRVVSVDNELRLAVVSIGRTAGVKRGMQFNVFRDIGASKRHLKGQVIVKKVYEHISEAFVTYQRGLGQNFYLLGDFDQPTKPELVEMIGNEGGKTVGEFTVTTNYLVVGNNASREVIREAENLRIPVLRAHQVESFLTSPDRIKPNDVLINPAFSINKKEKFLLFGDFKTASILLQQRIGKYGSTSAEVNNPDQVVPGSDYLVVGARGTGEANTSEIYKKANEYGVTVMREEELLAFLEE
ncbi:MAG: hypothetical protein QGF00_32600 [Planctomycetota bacterium]|jgi:NAD-dependent DNA ligase|nr:hypothetical protein [Planctomycetota bacterium]MDP7254383.1 hypothetical protein [Planctomycetota bacterium]